jgi:murein DD-endopeptidase MepM/ murein hydrolase activator NlpD
VRFLVNFGVVCFFQLSLSLLVQAQDFDGVLQQGALIVGHVEPEERVVLDGQAVKVGQDGVFVIGFDRDAGPESVLVVVDDQGNSRESKLDIKRRHYNIQRIEGIAKKIMSPNVENVKRARAESALVRKARAVSLDRLDFAGPFLWPLTGPITGVYGSQRVYNGEPKRPHYGVDVAAPIGTAVTTPAPGQVTLVHQDMFYSGGTLIIDHGHGVSSTLMHLSKVLVHVGDEVSPGDVVAEVGAGGRATGAHLDWRMNWKKARIDPQLLVGAMKVSIESQ